LYSFPLQRCDCQTHYTAPYATRELTPVAEPTARTLKEKCRSWCLFFQYRPRLTVFVESLDQMQQRILRNHRNLVRAPIPLRTLARERGPEQSRSETSSRTSQRVF